MPRPEESDKRELCVVYKKGECSGRPLYFGECGYRDMYRCPAICPLLVEDVFPEFAYGSSQPGR